MGHIDKRQEKQRALHDILLDLASKQNVLLPEEDDMETCKRKSREYLERLKVIYGGDDNKFRHQYSPLYALITRIAKEDDKDIEIFQTNLEVILTDLDEYEKGNNSTSGLFDKFFKLYDHLALEIARWQAASSLEGQVTGIEKKISDVRNQLTEDEKLSGEISKKIEAANQRFSKIQADFVAILAIFAAVVTVFSTGSNYLTSSIEAITGDSLSRLVAAVSLCGLVLLNALFMLMYFIGRITNNPIEPKHDSYVIVNAYLVFIFLFACLLSYASPPP